MLSYIKSVSGEFIFRTVIALVCLSMFSVDGLAQSVDISAQISVTTANESSILDSHTRNITSTADVTLTNSSSSIIIAPLHAVITINNANGTVLMPEALGGPAVSPYNKYYYDLSNKMSEGQLLPGAQVTFKVKFVRSALVRFTYGVTSYSIISTINQPPTANADANQTITLSPGQTTATVTLSGSGSDSDGTIAAYVWRGNPTPAAVAAPSVTLGVGTHTFTLTVTDNQGAASAPSSVTITVTAPSPAPVLTPQKTPVNVAVTAINGTAEASSTVKIFTAGTLIGTVMADGQGNFALPNVTLVEGTNIFTATATNAAGNESLPSAPLTIVLDTKPPVITVTAPQPGVVVSAPQVAITGTVDEPIASLTINGASTPLSASALTFEYVLTLATGENSALITATDLAGNVATTTITVQRDSTPPVVTITAPLSGLLTNNPQIQVSGTVDDATATVTIGGAAVTVVSRSAPLTGATFSVGYVLTDGDNNIQVKAVDKAGNEGTATITVTLDAQTPVVTLNAPATATAGTDVQISVNATDNRGLTLVDVSADGASLWSDSPNGAASANQNVSMRLSPSLSAGATVTVRARALDAAGNSGSATAVITIDKGADGPGWLQGKVLDDGRGLPLEGVQISVTDSKGQQQSLTTTADGAWFFELPSGLAQVEVVKSGFTTVRRDVTVRPGQRTSVLDSRLTRIDGTVHNIDIAGGVVKSVPFIIQNSSFTIDVIIPANTLSVPVDLRLTPISNQGLISSLPMGWSPLAALDLRLLDPATATPIDPQPLTAAATLNMPLPKGLGDTAVTAQLARYDATRRAWLAVSDVTIAANATTATAQINQPGQYALALADPAPANPPAPAAGQDVSAATLQPSTFSLQPDFSLTTTTGRVVPQAAPPSIGLRAAGDLLIVAKADAATPLVLTSGLIVNARISEKFDLTGGDKLQPASTTQDIVLYRVPCATSIAGGATEPPFDSAQGPTGASGSVSGAELRTTFPVAPSRDFTIVDLLLGKISIEITPPDSSGGVMVGADGARLLQPDGTALSIPAGALTGTVPITLATLPEASVSSLVGADFRLLRGVDIAITGQTLRSSATLSIPAPTGFDPSLPVVVAKKFDVKGGSKLKLVAMARLSGTIINSEPLTPELTNSSSSINSSGQYFFLQAVAPIGYIGGTITDAATAPFPGIQITAQSATLADLTGANGQYLLATATGEKLVTALDPVRGDTASANAVVQANTKTTLNLTVRMVPPTVTAITPANGATNVQPSVPVVVTFSKPMDKTTINATTLKLTDSTNSINSTITWNAEATTATVYPVDAFKQETIYTVTISSTVKDVQGYPLGQNTVSSFTVRRTTPPVMPPAGNVSGTFPDADGFITITGTQGSAAADNTVLLINDTSGEIVSVKPASNGSFTGKVRGQLGDEIKVVLMDNSGNQTLISYITFKSPDGSYLVTAKGGKVEGEGGSILDIPEGALVGAAVIKVTALQEANLPSPVPGPGNFLAAFIIDTNGIGFQKEVHLSIPVPNGFDPNTPVFVVRPSEVTNDDGTTEKVYEIIDSTKILNGRITTASPPFDGITGIGSYIFAAFPAVQQGIVSGYTYQEMNDLPGYQPAPAGEVETPTRDAAGNLTYRYDKPVPGAIIRTPSAWNYVSYSKSDGFYAGFTTLYVDVAVDYKVTATHPLTMQRVTKTGYMDQNNTIIPNLNFKLADKGTIPPDKDPPVINISAAMVPGHGTDASYSNGVATVGTELAVTITATDKLMGTATLSVELASEVYSNTTMTPLTLGNPSSRVVGTQIRYTYPPNFGANLSGSSSQILKPTELGLYRLIVDARDAAGNLSSKTLDIRVVRPGEIPISLDGAPRVIWSNPVKDAPDVMIDSSVTVIFSEAVSGVNNSTFMLYDTSTIPNQLVAATVTTDVNKGRMKGILVPNGNLAYGRTYKVVMTGGISDVAANASAGGALLALEPVNWRFTTKMPAANELNGSTFAARDIDYYFDAVSGKQYAYVAAGTDGWRVVNVTDTNNMSIVWPPADYRFPYGFDYRNLAVDQQNSLLAMTDNFNMGNNENHFGYVRFYSLANPTAPVIVGREKLAEAMSGIPQRVTMLNGYAYVSTVGVGIQVVDIKAAIDRQTAGGASNGSTIVGYFDTNNPVYYGAPMVFASYRSSAAALTTTTGYLLTLDLSFPTMPSLLTAYQPENPSVPGTKLRFGVMAAAADFAYRDPASGNLKMMDLVVAGLTSGGVHIVNLTEPANPQLVGKVRNQDGSDATLIPRDITVNATLGLAIAPALDGVYVIDIRNPLDPRVLNKITQLPTSSVNPDGTPVMIRLDGNQALIEKNGVVYLANPTKGIKALNLGAGVKISCNSNGPCGP